MEQVYRCHFFKQHLLTSCLCHILVILVIFHLCIIILFVMVTGELWCHCYNCFKVPLSAPEYNVALGQPTVTATVFTNPSTD